MRADRGGRHGSRRPLTVRDVMRTGDEVARVETWTSLHDAIYEMARGRLGITAVTDAEGRLVGCLSDGDMRRLLERDDAPPLDSPVGELMNPRARTVGADVLASAAFELMKKHRVSSLFVCDAENRLGGIVHRNLQWRLGPTEDGPKE